MLGDVDVAKLLTDVSREHTLKGMFFKRYVAALGPAWSTVAASLDRAPPRGVYHAFEDYPLVDYLRLLDHVARERFPGSAREAYRLVARGEIDVFAASTLGKVTLSLLRDPSAALLRYPEVFGVLARAPAVTAARLGPTSVRLAFSKLQGAVEYAVGVSEGIVLAFDELPAVHARVARDRSATLDVRWGPDAAGAAAKPTRGRRI